MGFSPSPYFVSKDMLVIEEAVSGSRFDLHNVLRWANIILNLSCTGNFNPARPWVYKVRSDDSIAADIYWYMDDG